MQQLTRMTVELPTELIRETESAIKAGKIKNLNEFIALALTHELSLLEEVNSDSEVKNSSIWELGTNPVICDVVDASENLDKYLY
jgi:metal-responsive CopG/Arc/MetJ family transcriptional regulator